LFIDTVNVQAMFSDVLSNLIQLRFDIEYLEAISREYSSLFTQDHHVK